MKNWIEMKKRHNINIHEELNKLAITALMGFLLITIIPCEEYLILNILIDAIYIRIGILMIWVLFFVYRFVKALEDEIMILAGYSYWLMVIYMVFILVLTIYTRDLPYLLDTVNTHTNMDMFEEVAAAAKKALLKSSYEKSYYCAATGITKKTYILTGEKYTILGQKHFLFLNYKEGKFIDAQIIKTKNYYISIKELIPDNKDGELCLELIQKMQLQKDIFNYNKLHTNESLQVYFTNSKQPFIEKGGDANNCRK